MGRSSFCAFRWRPPLCLPRCRPIGFPPRSMSPSAFVTFLAAVSLLAGAPQPGAYILVDDLNVVFIVLNTFVGFTASVFSASYIAHEIETGRLTAYESALLSRDVSVPAVCDEPGADRQQYRPDVGGDRMRDADNGADGRHLPHAGSDRGGLEIFHPRQRRHRACAVRHDPCLYGRAAGRRRGRRRRCCGRA